MRRGLIALMMLTLWLSSCTVPAMAQSTGESRRSTELSDLLNLSSSQRSQLETVHKRYADKKKQLRDQIATRRQDVAQQLVSDTPDRATIERTLNDIVVLEGQRQKLMIDEFFDVLQILKPDQQKIFRDHVMRHIIHTR